jgi:hypothetical protein
VPGLKVFKSTVFLYVDDNDTGKPEIRLALKQGGLTWSD